MNRVSLNNHIVNPKSVIDINPNRSLEVHKTVVKFVKP